MRKPFKLEVVKASEVTHLEHYSGRIGLGPDPKRRWRGELRWKGMIYRSNPHLRRRNWWASSRPDIWVSIDDMMITYYCRTRSLVILNDLDYTPEQLTLKEVDL